MITPFHYLALSAALFSIGIIGILLRRNVILILLSIEILFNAANLAFAAFSKLHGNLDGQVIALFVIAAAASEVTVALAITVLVYRNWNSIRTDETNLLKG
jgi:NADH-quinone oxidoreductase subunit K